MKYFVFRNYTIEPFFAGFDARFSGYGDISFVDKTADAYIWFYLAPYKADNDSIAQEIRHYCQVLDLVYSYLDKNKQFIAFTMARLYAVKYVTSNTELESAVAEYNLKLYSMSANPNVKFIDIREFYRGVSEEQLIDWKYYYLSRIPLNPKLVPRFEQWFARQLEIIELKRKKCVVLDLDNTLWSGVLGEDGADGIKMGEDYPGNVYRFFQFYLMELGHAGVILTVCSKNNESDVLAVWENHPDMILRKDSFSAYRVNWNNKADNIREIAEELNIGLDSMVFIDDSPAERELVKRNLPQVIVPEFPLRPYLYPIFIKYITDTYFSAYALTKEDLGKTRQYRENNERKHYKNQFVDMNSYISGLEIELAVETLNEYNKARFAQMTQKTNQFNLTTRRYTEADIQGFVDKGHLVYGLRVKDKFGDNGLAGLMIVTIDKQDAWIDTLLLSCRVLGREIEYVFVEYILAKLERLGLARVYAIYIKTVKNAQVENFYEALGFDVKKQSGECKEYELVLGNKGSSRLDKYADKYALEDLCVNE
jgi:FkbH-like protein